MQTISDVTGMQALALRMRHEGRRIALAPTMGYLHEGHASLMRRARTAGDVLVVSLFVNPTQFGPGEDFERYPRDLERDSTLCRAEGVDILFCPSARDMYAPNHSVYVEETRLSAGLCGAARPGHFRGVATVVAKLLNIVQPHVAVFGQKDFQQARVIAQMVRDLNFPVEIVIAPTVREADGLAMSSRNAYLSAEERAEAPRISAALRLAEAKFAQGERDTAVLRATARAVIEASPILRIEYLEVVDPADLRPLHRLEDRALVAVAVRAGTTRLIDNALLQSR